MTDPLPIWLVFVLAVFATFRLSLMFSKESGPGRVFAKLRRTAPPRSSLREGVSCILCNSVWWSAGVCSALAWLGFVEWRMVPLWWLAVSGGAVVCNQQWTKGDL